MKKKPKYKFRLKAGDKVIVRFNHIQRINATVEGFYCYGMKLKEYGVIPFIAGRFYGVGYSSDTYGTDVIYTLKKDWHYIPAKICEWLRLKLPRKIGEFIFLF